MKVRKLLHVLAVCSLIIVIGILSNIIATLVLIKYKVIVDGILGLVIFFLGYRVYVTIERQKRTSGKLIDELITYPLNIKFFVFMFLAASVVQWSFEAIFIAVRYLIRQAGLGS